MNINKTNQIIENGQILTIIQKSFNDGSLEKHLHENELARKQLNGLLETLDNDDLQTHYTIDSMMDRLAANYKDDTLATALQDDTPMDDLTRSAWIKFAKDLPTEEPVNKHQPKTSNKNHTHSIKRRLLPAIAKGVFAGAAIFTAAHYTLEAKGGSLLNRAQCVTSDIGVNIRTEPASFKREQTVITRLPYQTVINTHGAKINDAWYRATSQYEGQKITGYVHNDFIGRCP